MISHKNEFFILGQINEKRKKNHTNPFGRKNISWPRINDCSANAPMTHRHKPQIFRIHRNKVAHSEIGINMKSFASIRNTLFAIILSARLICIQAILVVTLNDPNDNQFIQFLANFIVSCERALPRTNIHIFKSKKLVD